MVYYHDFFLWKLKIQVYQKYKKFLVEVLLFMDECKNILFFFEKQWIRC